MFGLFGVLDSNGWYREQLLRKIQETDVKIMLLKMMPPLFRISMTLAAALYSASSIIGTHSESD